MFLQNPEKHERVYLHKQPGFLYLRSSYIENTIVYINYNWILKWNFLIKFASDHKCWKINLERNLKSTYTLCAFFFFSFKIPTARWKSVCFNFHISSYSIEGTALCWYKRSWLKIWFEMYWEEEQTWIALFNYPGSF